MAQPNPLHHTNLQKIPEACLLLVVHRHHILKVEEEVGHKQKQVGMGLASSYCVLVDPLVVVLLDENSGTLNDHIHLNLASFLFVLERKSRLASFHNSVEFQNQHAMPS